MTRDELIESTRRLIVDGDGLIATPSLEDLRAWLRRSDELLGEAWGSMDRYHLAWLMVGKPKDTVRGRPMTPREEAAYVREVAAQKSSALRMSLDAVERQGMPFRGETGGIGPGLGSGAPSGDAAPGAGAGRDAQAGAGIGQAGAGIGQAGTGIDQAGGRFGLPSEADDLAERVRQAREDAALHADHDVPRAPRPERMQR